MTTKTRMNHMPEAHGFDWKHLPGPIRINDALSGDIRVLPLARVAP